MNRTWKDTKEHLCELNQKRYIHFDFPIRNNEKERIIKRITQEIYNHRYLPFIRVDIIYPKYSKGNKQVKNKVRKITLPAHHDALIYQYFGYELSKRYEMYVEDTSLDRISVAYRLDKHISNITVAKEAIDFVTSQEKCWIIKGDFKHFFDNLNHKVLKNQVQLLLGNAYDQSYIKMLKSIMNYRFVTKKTLEKQLTHANVDFPYKKMGSKAYTNNLRQLGNLLKQKVINLSPKNHRGIPQGTAVSAVLANIYMIQFDELLAEMMNKYNGIYRRYSDDFIIIIPQADISYEDIKNLKNEIITKSNEINKLEIEHAKTQLLSYSKEAKSIYKYNDVGWKKSSLSYLGFSFDGVSVSLRSNSIYKFIYRSKRTINKYITLRDVRERYLRKEGPTSYVKKYNDQGIKIYRLANPTELYRKERIYALAGTMSERTFGTYHRAVVRQCLALFNIERRSSMLAYAKRAQKEFQYKTRGKYRVVIQRQVEKQIRRNQRKVGGINNEW
ncbi:reverse transcriptase/maturase family protein [Limosilactobacillus reuteri]|uniref:reverse transcriptase/maturase family protein n=1 Tax=Limosilactobacillus reuteri TaxID=1598 RepID=UPI001E53B74C|nr:reverse transcriptase/maturase family protein [Limosilactobacillus reuteri]MCC4423240.1 reverse transcriptase/maturase family protein [Limosilactobacillus reuteri]